MELKLPLDVCAMVVGPARLRILDEKTLILDEGEASFTVPPKGRGFRVITPLMSAVDLDTEFVTISGWSERNEIHVIKGEVMVSSGSGEERLMIGGEAMAVETDGSVEDIDHLKTHFQPELPERATMLLEDDFESWAADGSHVLELLDWECSGRLQPDQFVVGFK